jgi:hypothetical protein
MISFFDRFVFRPRAKGYVSFRRLSRGESRWFRTAGREFGLWYVTVHAFGLYFGIIGPFA